MDVTGHYKLITCFLPKGKAIEIVGLLNDERGIFSSSVTSGRGRGLVESVSFGAWGEVDILTVVVSADEADDTFEFIYDRGDVDRLNGGLMYQVGLTGSTKYQIPEIPAED